LTQEYRQASQLPIPLRGENKQTIYDHEDSRGGRLDRFKGNNASAFTQRRHPI
jgi:hypothetical protein